MTQEKVPWVQILPAAGFRGVPEGEVLRDVEQLYRKAVAKPVESVIELLKTRRKLDIAQKACKEAADSATKLENLLKELLESDILLCRKEILLTEEGEPPRLLCWVHNNQLKNLAIHEDVDVADLPHTGATMSPWQDTCRNAMGEALNPEPPN